MENNSLVRPTGKFPGKGIPDLPVGTFRMDFSVPLPRFSNFIPVPGPQKEICHVHLGNNGLRHSVSVYNICFFSTDSMESLSNHKCLPLGIGRYLVFEIIYSNAHLHLGLLGVLSGNVRRARICDVKWNDLFANKNSKAFPSEVSETFF